MRGRPSGLPGLLTYRFANLRTAATLSFGDEIGSLLNQVRDGMSCRSTYRCKPIFLIVLFC
ncbi:hypothetical protein EMIT0196P_150071 [Pseudomonas chlororaphis]